MRRHDDEGLEVFASPLQVRESDGTVGIGPASDQQLVGPADERDLGVRIGLQGGQRVHPDHEFVIGHVGHDAHVRRHHPFRRSTPATFGVPREEDENALPRTVEERAQVNGRDRVLIPLRGDLHLLAMHALSQMPRRAVLMVVALIKEMYEVVLKDLYDLDLDLLDIDGLDPDPSLALQRQVESLIHKGDRRLKILQLHALPKLSVELGEVLCHQTLLHGNRVRLPRLEGPSKMEIVPAPFQAIGDLRLHFDVLLRGFRVHSG